MEQYRQILLCIDQPERDGRMLAYMAAIVERAGSEAVHLLHVRPPDGDAGADRSSGDEITPETLRALAAGRLDGGRDDLVRCAVVPGEPLIEILRYAHDEDVDLIIVGRRSSDGEEAASEAILARRIARKATCSVLVLPEDAQVKADRLLVPVRDSPCSANALEVAYGIADAVEAEVVVLNLYRVHGGYARVGTSLEDHQSMLHTQAERECACLLRRLGLAEEKVACACTPDLHGRPVSIIIEWITRESADLVVIGARGRTGAAGVLLGTVTEQLIQCCPVPLLAVKKKGECIGVLRALLTIAGQE